MPRGNAVLDGDDDAPKRFAAVPRRHRTRTVQEMVIPPNYPHWRRERRVPWLTLSGRWLEHAGFTPGMQVAIEVRQNKLTIRNGRPRRARPPHSVASDEPPQVPREQHAAGPAPGAASETPGAGPSGPPQTGASTCESDRSGSCSRPEPPTTSATP